MKQIYNFSPTQFFKEEHKKTQIYLHHTAGNSNGKGVFQGWETNAVQVATCVSISGKGKGTVDGEIWQGFDAKYWAYHLGLQTDVFKKLGLPYLPLDKTSIAIEICNWGMLTKTAKGFLTYVNTVVPDDEVVEYPEKFKGFQYYHKYSEAQIESVRQLLIEWNKTFGIPINFKGIEIFGLDKRAFANEPGVYTHNSIRVDKSDIHPQKEMIEMLKSL